MSVFLAVAPWVAVLMLALIPFGAYVHRRTHPRGHYREHR